MPFQRLLVALWLVIFGLPLCPAITTPQDVRAAFQELAALDEETAAISTDSGGFSEKVIALRHRLRDYALGSLIDAASRAATMDVVPDLATRRIEEAKLPLSAPAPWMPENRKAYASIEVLRVDGAPQWVGAKVTIALPCGADQSLYFLEIAPKSADGAGFDTEFRLASEKPLDSLRDAAIDYSFATWVSPDGQQLRLGTVATSGGCTSYWHPMSMQVLEPGDHSYRPVRLYEQNRTAYLGTVVRPLVKSVANGFRFEYQTQFFLDLDRHNRSAETTVIFDGTRVRLEPPATQDPAEFLDEWVSSSWLESRRWTVGSRTENLRSWHHTLSDGTRNRAVTELVGIGECQNSGLVWVQIDRGESPNRTQSIYSLLRKTSKGYQVDRFAEDLPTSCRTPRKDPSPPVN